MELVTTPYISSLDVASFIGGLALGPLSFHTLPLMAMALLLPGLR